MTHSHEPPIRSVETSAVDGARPDQRPSEETQRLIDEIIERHRETLDYLSR